MREIRWERMAKKADELDELSQERFRHVLSTLASRVRALRKASNMSLRQFSAVVGVRPATLVAIEAGSMNVSLLIVFMIAQALGVDLSILLEGTASVSLESSVVAGLGTSVEGINGVSNHVTEGRGANANILDVLQNGAADEQQVLEYVDKNSDANLT
jgi:transcriptional regulator with XRE-family HTH domain